MLQSELFTKTQKYAPKDETAINAQLLIRAGFIYKEMNAIGGAELIMTNLQRKELWASTDRWDDQKVDIWFKTELKNGSEVGLAWSHEEPISEMMKSYVHSFRDLPIFVYQFQ